MTIDPDETLQRKVDAVLKKHLVDPNRFVRNLLQGAVYSAVASAFSSYTRDEVADKIAFNMLDWSDDAAFLFALYLQPDAFTPEEVDDGIRGFVYHASGHILDAAHILGFEPRRSADGS